MGKHRDAAYEIAGDTCPDDGLVAAARSSWDQAVELGERHGYRNAQATVLAPTGTISFLMDCDTTGIEPDFSLVKFKELVGGGQMTIVNRTVPLALQTLGYAQGNIDQIVAYVNEHGTIVGAPGLREQHLPVFDVAVGERAISHMGHIKMMAAAQPFISGAISKTVNMPADTTVDDIGKEGSTLRGMMNAFATSVSIALQYGVPLETLVRKFSYMGFDPEGATGNPEIPFAKSMPDYIMRWLASRFLDVDTQEELGIMTPEVRARKAAQDALMRGDTAAPVVEEEKGANGAGNGAPNAQASSPEPKPAAAAFTDDPPVIPAKLQGLDLGPACEQCGGMMQRTGSCYTCSSCGNNTGCG